VSRRGDDGGDTTASGDDEFSAEDEFRDWAAAAEESAEAAEPKSGLMGRMFGRSAKSPDPEPAPNLAAVPGPADLEDPDPEQLGVFRAIDPTEGPPQEMEAVAAFEEEEPATYFDGDTAPDAAEQPEPEMSPEEAESKSEVPAVGAAGSPSFGQLWRRHMDDHADSTEGATDFTSEDYLAATTREYAGLAEAVARAEEEGTEQMAVSAEIRGLESGLVGLDDMVNAETAASTEDLIEPPAGSDLSMRVLTGLGLLFVFAASLLSPFGIGALIFVILMIAAGEMYSALIRGGYHPLSIFGFLGIAGAFAGTWAAGPVAVPISILLMTVAVLLFYATVPGRRAALENASLTIMVAAWIGGLGAFAFDFLGSDDYVWLVLGLVVTVAAMDIGQYFVGRRIGRRPLAPVVSPKKTVEGYVAGIIVAIAVGAAFAWAEPFEMTDGLLIGAVVAIVSPLGDLSVSVIKRALGVKDMGYILPGHGGVLDRVDAMIITIPALWIAYSWMGLFS